MALAYYQLRDYENCLKYCELSLEKNSKDKWALVNKGNALLELGRVDDAVIEYNKALDEDDKFALALRDKALIYMTLDNYKEAINYYKRYCELVSNDLNALYCLGGALYEERMYEEVLNICDKILKIDKYHLITYCRKATSLCHIGKFEEGLSSLEEALSIDPTYALGYYHKARIFSHLRYKEGALHSLNIAFELCPDYKNIAMNDIQLNNLRFFSEFHEMIK